MGTLSGTSLSTLCDDVQFNCSISDARYARDYSLCIYLLRMREFYRWRFNLPLLQKLQTNTVGEWISKLEMQWDEIEEYDFKSLTINNEQFDPFDTDAINQQLIESGHIYSAGIGRLGQPHFMLAELNDTAYNRGVNSYECGKELARDSITMPAMAKGQMIFIRHDSIKRHLLQMVEEWRLNKQAGPMQRIVDHYQLEDTERFEEHLVRATMDFSAVYREHEYGEVAAGRLIGDRYHPLLQKVAGTRSEFYLRAVRDMLADTLSTWPRMLTQSSVLELDFWLASLNGAREELMKVTGLTQRLLSENEDHKRLKILSDIIESEQSRWSALMESILRLNESTSGKIDIKTQILSNLAGSTNTSPAP